MPRKKKEETASKSTAKPKTKAVAKPKVPKVTKAAAKPVKAKKVVAPKKPTVRKAKVVVPKAKTATPRKTARVETEPSLVAASTFKPLPRQGENQLVAFVRDPQCVFTYWEITPQRLEEVKKELQDEFKNSHMVLRLYEISANGDRHLVDELRLEPGQINQYVEIKQNGGTYQFEIAMKTPTGKVITYVASKAVMTGGHSPLDVADPIGAPWNSLSPDMSPEMQAYFEQQGFWDVSESTTGVSSMENRQRRSKDHWSSSF